MSVEEKHCPGCKQVKPFSMFSTKKTGKLASWCKTCTGNAIKDWHKRHPDVQRNKNYKLNHKITLEEYNALLASQGGVCAACGNPDAYLHYGKQRSLAVDHCHETGKFRGLLCGSCNQALGLLEDSPERIEALLRYITKSGENHE